MCGNQCSKHTCFAVSPPDGAKLGTLLLDFLTAAISTSLPLPSNSPKHCEDMKDIVQISSEQQYTFAAKDVMVILARCLLPKLDVYLSPPKPPYKTTILKVSLRASVPDFKATDLVR